MGSELDDYGTVEGMKEMMTVSTCLASHKILRDDHWCIGNVTSPVSREEAKRKVGVADHRSSKANNRKGRGG